MQAGFCVSATIVTYIDAELVTHFNVRFFIVYAGLL